MVPLRPAIKSVGASCIAVPSKPIMSIPPTRSASDVFTTLLAYKNRAKRPFSRVSTVRARAVPEEHP